MTMTTTTTPQDIAAAMQRVHGVLLRKPDLGLHDDSPATTRWEHGTRLTTSHPNGTRIPSDMPTELGGTGDQITPGWLFRAGLAACSGTMVVMNAAAQGIELAELEVKATSRTDTRGMLGMAGVDGQPVSAGPQDLQLLVRIAANGVASARLRALVDTSLRCSPVSNALPASAVTVHVEVIAA